jgi:hypothetical protein
MPAIPAEEKNPYILTVSGAFRNFLVSITMELPRQPLAKRCVNLSTHTASIDERLYFP